MIKYRKNDHIISVTGHAGYAQKGFDIVCEAVSILVQTLIQTADVINQPLKVEKLESGIFIVNIQDLKPEAELLVLNFDVGMRLLCSAYPEYIKTEH